MDTTELERATQCSVEVQRAKDATYYWTIKAYHAPGEEDVAIERIVHADEQLRGMFLTPPPTWPTAVFRPDIK